MDGIRKFRTAFCLWNSLSWAISGLECTISLSVLQKTKATLFSHVQNSVFLTSRPILCPYSLQTLYRIKSAVSRSISCFMIFAI